MLPPVDAWPVSSVADLSKTMLPPLAVLVFARIEIEVELSFAPATGPVPGSSGAPATSKSMPPPVVRLKSAELVILPLASIDKSPTTPISPLMSTSPAVL